MLSMSMWNLSTMSKCGISTLIRLCGGKSGFRLRLIPLSGCGHGIHTSCLSHSPAKMDYYDILEVPRSAKPSHIKKAYFKLAKRCHPDMVAPKIKSGDVTQAEAEKLRRTFESATEAYTCLTDPKQKSFYDRHGYVSKELRKQGESNIYDYQSTFYRSYRESTATEDWFRTKGHSWTDPKPSFRQRLKNFYVEWQYGMMYYNFPWEIKKTLLYFSTMLLFGLGVISLFDMFSQAVYDKLPDGHPYKTRKINDRFKKDYYENDILAFAGLRKEGTRRQALTELYEDEEQAKVNKKESEFKDSLESNTKPMLKSYNKEREERRRLREERRRMEQHRMHKEYLQRELERKEREKQSLEREMRMLEMEIEEEEERRKKRKKKIVEHA